MGRFRSRGDSLRIGLSLFMISGAILGSVFCNAMSVEMKQELLLQEKAFLSATVLADMKLETLFLRILPKRLCMLLILFLISASPYAYVLFLLAAGYAGFTAAILICPLTMSAGALGIWNYMLLLFPHGIVYGFVAYLFIWWMMPDGRRLRVSAVLILISVTIIGVAAESFVNPWFLTFL